MEIKRAVEAVFNISESENSNAVECVQRCNGVYKIFLSEKKDRNQLLIKGMSIRGFSITVYGENPLSIDGQDAVRLKIKNIDYETPDVEVVKALKSIGFTLASNIMYECFRNEEGKLLKTKNGHRFVFISKPTSPFSEKITIGNDTNVHLWYKGIEKNIEELNKSAAENKASSDEATKSAGTNPSGPPETDQSAAEWKADGARQAQRFIDEFFKQQPPQQQADATISNTVTQNIGSSQQQDQHASPLKEPDDNLSNTGNQNESGSQPQKQPATAGQVDTHHESFEIDDHSEMHDSSVAHDDIAVLENGATNDSDPAKQREHLQNLQNVVSTRLWDIILRRKRKVTFSS